MSYFMSKKKLFAIVLLTALISCVLTVAGLFALFDVNGVGAVQLVRFFGTKKLIEERYVDEVDQAKLMDGAISGMVGALGDPHSAYLNADTFKALKQHTEGAFGGIGVTMGFKDGRVHILSVLEGTPGEEAGLRAGDEILAVDGTPVSEWPFEEVALHIRGEQGTRVSLTIGRDGGEQDYTLTRQVITVATAKGRLLEDTDGLGYIRIASFSENTGQEFRTEYEKLREQGMKGLIIDLRQNGGGLISSCVDIAKLLVPEGPVVSVVQRDGSKEEYDSDLKESPYPLVVLVDGNSASASEILAGALQDTGAATLVGTKTYGKGSVQIVVPLFQEDGIKLTIAKYYTPSGRSIDGTGITPDIELDFKEGDNTDVQLAKAEEVLQQKVR